MVPSSVLCRTQEILHRRRAADTLLENVRVIATTAAVAWGHEAVAAERRERRKEKVGLFAEAAAVRNGEVDALDLLLSENPDRIMAHGRDEANEDQSDRPVPA